MQLDKQPPVVLGFPLADKLAVLICFPALGALVGWLIPALGRWAVTWSGALPLRPVFKLLSRVDGDWEVIGAIAVGLLLGLGIAFVAIAESMTLTVAGSALTITIEDRTRTFPRADVDAVFLDGKLLVILDRDSRQLLREPTEANREAVASALRQQGYPWRDADPYADLFRRWVKGGAELPAGADAVLGAREVALRKRAKRDAGELRDAVQDLGLVVRDEGTRQYWRPLVRP